MGYRRQEHRPELSESEALSQRKLELKQSGSEGRHPRTASKGGLVLLSKSMARDHAREGLRVNAICPGDVDTPMLAGEAEGSGLSLDEYMEEMNAAVPSGRVGDPEDVAALAVFLASDAAAHINGTAILVDGAANA